MPETHPIRELLRRDANALLEKVHDVESPSIATEAVVMPWVPPPKGPESYAKLAAGLTTRKNLTRLSSLGLYDVREGVARRNVWEADNVVTSGLRAIYNLDEAASEMERAKAVGERWQDVVSRTESVLAALRSAVKTEGDIMNFLFGDRKPSESASRKLEDWPEMLTSPFLDADLVLDNGRVEIGATNLREARLSDFGATLLDRVGQTVARARAPGVGAFFELGNLQLSALRPVATFRRGAEHPRDGLKVPFLIALQGRPDKNSETPAEAAAGSWIGDIGDEVVEPYRLAAEAFFAQNDAVPDASPDDRLKMEWLVAWFRDFVEDELPPEAPPQLRAVSTHVQRGSFGGTPVARCGYVSWAIDEVGDAARAERIKNATTDAASRISWSSNAPACEAHVTDSPPAWRLADPDRPAEGYRSAAVMSGDLGLLRMPEQPRASPFHAMLFFADVVA